MKITGLTVHILQPRPNPVRENPDYKYSLDRQYGIAVVHTDEGVEGIVHGSGTVEGADSIRVLARRWAQNRGHIEGQDPFDRGRIQQVLSRRFQWAKEELSLIDYLLWDIAGKALGKPVYKLLGATREKVPAYASTLGHISDERYLEVVLEAKEMGFTAIKVHPYCIADDDIRLCYKVREAVGDEMVLMLDPIGTPGPYNRHDAFRVARVLDELGFYWLEDPLPVTDLEGLARLREACQVVQVRAHDNAQDIRQVGTMIRHGCMDIIGGGPAPGITGLMKVAALAEANHMKLEPHDFGGGNASLHVLLAITNGDYHEVAVPIGSFHEKMYPGIYLDVPSIDSEGYTHAPTKPGLGFEFDMNEVERWTAETVKV